MRFTYTAHQWVPWASSLLALLAFACLVLGNPNPIILVAVGANVASQSLLYLRLRAQVVAYRRLAEAQLDRGIAVALMQSNPELLNLSGTKPSQVLNEAVKEVMGDA